MPSVFRDYQWKISYSNNENNPIADFYIPALECGIQCDIKLGFFYNIYNCRILTY